MSDSVWAAAVKRLLVAKHWTQGELAKQSGVRENTLSDALRGKTSPRLDTLEKICAPNALNVPMWRLFVDERQADLLTRQQQADALVTRESDVASRVQARVLQKLTDLVRLETESELANGQSVSQSANQLTRPVAVKSKHKKRA